MEQASYQSSNEDPVAPYTKLARLADILQEIFFKFRENTYDASLWKIDYMNGIMFTYDQPGLNSLPLAQLLAMCHGMDDEKTLLARFGCTQAVALMGDILVHGLTGMSYHVMVALGNMKEPFRKFFRVVVSGEFDFQDPVHEFFKITLLDTIPEQAFALDLSGAQYGYYDPLIPFEQYVGERVRQLMPEKELEAVKRSYRIPGTVPGRKEWKRFVAQGIFDSIKQWEMEKGFLLGDLLGFSEADFGVLKIELLKCVDNALARYL